MEALVAILEALYWGFALLSESVFGLRFLVSGRYRRETQARWSRQSRMRTMTEILGATLSLAIVVCLLGLLTRVV